MDLGLKEKSVVVTGGASNIGRAIVHAFAEEGAKVVIADIDTDQGRRVADEARELGAAQAEVIACDVTQLDSVKSMFKQTLENFGALDVLVNNVGWDRLMYFTDTTPELWQQIIQINFVGVLNCTHTALETMVAQGYGSIVSLSSDASRQGEPREAVYGAMKAGVSNFMKTIARENGRYGIRCNVVCPGVTIPEEDQRGANSMWAKRDVSFTDEQVPKIAQALPLKKMGTPEDVANAVAFLASARAGHITGQVLSVSGGYSIVG